jgi:hypothetical protein
MNEVPSNPEDIREELRIIQIEYPNARIQEIKFHYLPDDVSMELGDWGPFLSSITFVSGNDTIVRNY